MNAISWILIFLMVFIVAMVTIVIVYLLSFDISGTVKGKYNDMRLKHAQAAQRDIDKRMSYDIVSEMLSKKGIRYRMGDNFSPFDYTALRLLIAVILALVGLIISPWLTIVGFVGGYFLVGFYFNYENKNDNNEMMDDIATVFGIVSLQLKNGVFLTEVIYECYLTVEHPRLKKALLELSMEIEKFGSISEAAVSFRMKFENKHLDTFAKTLEQAEVTGTAADLFKDIESQIDSINEAIAIREEQKVNSISFLFQTLVFVGSMLFVVYIVVQMFTGSMSSLS